MSKKQKFLDIVKVFAPLIIAIIKPSLAPVASDITEAINEAEQIPDAKGTDKLQHVQKIAKKTVDATNNLGITKINTEELSNNVDEAVTAVIKVVNTLNVPDEKQPW